MSMIRNYRLESRTQRFKLPIRQKPYFLRVAPGIALGYRRCKTAGSWSVFVRNGGGSLLRRFALGDDHEPSNGKNVLTFFEAQRAAVEIGRRGLEGVDAGSVSL